MWGKNNPKLDALVNRDFNGDALFIFVVIIGLYEMTTKRGHYKKILRIIMNCIVFGTFLSKKIPIKNLYDAIFNSAWFIASIVLILMVIRIIFISKKYSTFSN